MMSYRQLDELPNIPIAGIQVGDTSLLTKDGVIHLPDCSIVKASYTRDGKAICTCGADLADPKEFLEREVTA